MKVLTKYPVYIDSQRAGEAGNEWLYAPGDTDGGPKKKLGQKISEGIGKASQSGAIDAAANLLKLFGKSGQAPAGGPTPEQVAAELKRQEELRKEEERKKRNMTIGIVVGAVVVVGIIAAIMLSKRGEAKTI
jgi:predicted nucleic acid-binding Zn ribbon protein